MRFIPVLAIAILGLLAVGVACGGDDDRIEQMLADSREVYAEQANQQANIDEQFERCSPGWAKATANNNTDRLVELMENTLADYLSMQNADALAADTERLLLDYCDDGDAESYCLALTDSIVAHTVGYIDAMGGKEVIDSGCLNRIKSDTEAALDVEVGDCFGETEAGFVNAACSEPNTWITIAIWKIPDATLPSLTKLDEYGMENCPGDEPFFLVPTEETWAFGDRLIVCLE
jgi:hypothetical protein